MQQRIDLILRWRNLARWQRRSVRLGVLLLVLSGVATYLFTDLVFGPPREVASDSLPNDWAMFRHDLGRTGGASSTAQAPRGAVRWTFATGAAIHSSPAVANGTVFVGSKDSTLYALDALTGAERWQTRVGGPIDSSPAVVDGVVYFGANDGRLRALDAETGRELWAFATPFAINSSPAVADGLVYFGGTDRMVYAVDVATGEERWAFDAGGHLQSSPVVANGVVHTGVLGQYFYALHARDGRRRLEFFFGSAVFSSPAVVGETVYVTTENGNLHAIDGGARSWPREHDLRRYLLRAYVWGWLKGQPAPQSGSLWQLEIGGTAKSTPLVANSSLFAGFGRRLVAVDLARRGVRWHLRPRAR
jgi:outer membrane protein assembly factor BamB